MGNSAKSITIQDVARAAGVSVSTVSRVLNDKDDVASDTSLKVKQVIAELGYTSSLVAKSMRSRRTGVIGLILPDLEDPFCIQVMKGIHHAIVALGYDLIAYTSGTIKKDSKAERERHYVSLLNGSLTDGIILVTPAASTFSTPAPLVAIDPNNQCPDCMTVIATNREGALAGMEYLLGLGHRRIGYIGGRPDLQCARQRLQGYKAALREASIALDSDLIAVGDFTRATGYGCAQRLLALPEPPTAIFAANDQSAIGAIEAAREADIRVPDDLSVLGFDNIPEAAFYHPALTTIDQFIDKMGYVATEMLVALIQGKSLGSDGYKMPTQLVVRDSCRAPSWAVERAIGRKEVIGSTTRSDGKGAGLQLPSAER
jgi:LacI family transcriptional regulator